MTTQAHPLLRRAARAVRRLVPASIRSELRRWMFSSLDLTWQMRSGIHLRVERYFDWIVFNEIFVNGDYDQAIMLALDRSRQPMHIVDLGANAGFFTLRAFDRLLERGMGRESMAITAIEADPRRAAEYELRVLEENGLRSYVQLIRGLAGRRSGMGRLITDCSSTTDQTKHTLMPYLDLSQILASVGRIDLLKCDIEGSEEDFIEAYPELLGRTQVAVFEVHARHCNVEHCRTLLREYGFTHETTRRPGTDYSICTVWR